MSGDSLTWFDQPSPASEDEVVAVERDLGYKLPNDYREFAKRFSGGSPNETDFEFSDDEVGTFHASASEFFNLHVNDDRNVVRWMKRTEFFPADLVPIAGDGGGNYVCLDYRSASNPIVVFWHNGRRGMTNETSFVAKTFSEFIELLHLPDDSN